jgi:hypothetical protein
MELDLIFPITSELISKLLSLKDIETFFLRGFKNRLGLFNKPELTIEDVNQCIVMIEEELKNDFINSEKEIISKLFSSKIPDRIALAKLLDKAIISVEKTLAPGNTKAFLMELDKNIPISKFEQKVNPNAKLQHGLRIRELAVSFSSMSERYLLEYLDEMSQNGKQKNIPNLRDYIQPKILHELCKKLEEDQWIKMQTTGSFVWQFKDAEKVIPNEYDKSQRSQRRKTISVREASLITLSIMIDERKWMFIAEKEFTKTRQRAIAFLNFFGLLPKDKKEIENKVRYFYKDVLGDVEYYSENFHYLDGLKKYQQS